MVRFASTFYQIYNFISFQRFLNAEKKKNKKMEKK